MHGKKHGLVVKGTTGSASAAGSVSGRAILRRILSQRPLPVGGHVSSAAFKATFPQKHFAAFSALIHYSTVTPHLRTLAEQPAL